jgi:hypothetical protein
MDISVLYNEIAQPKYLEKTFLEEYLPFDEKNEDNNQSFQENKPFLQNTNRTFQWDERNLLISVKGNWDSTNQNFENTIIDDQSEDSSNSNENKMIIAEKRYEYSFDDQGNWTERREIIMIREGDYLFPSEGKTIHRTITYDVSGEQHE